MSLDAIFTWLDRDPIVAALLILLVAGSIAVLAIEAWASWREHRAEQRRQKARGGYLSFTSDHARHRLGETTGHERGQRR